MSNINYVVFEGDGFPVDKSLLDNITYEQRQLLTEMMESGHYQGGIMVDKFLRNDWSINLEKLELAVTLIVTALEANSPDKDVTLSLKGLNNYYSLRNIAGNLDKEREERTFLLGFISSIAGEASKRDTLVVKYVND